MKPLSWMPDSMCQPAQGGLSSGRDEQNSDNMRQLGELTNLEEFLSGNHGGDPLQMDVFQDLLSADTVPDHTFCGGLSTEAAETCGQSRQYPSPQTPMELPSIGHGLPSVLKSQPNFRMNCRAFDGLPGSGVAVPPVMMMPQSVHNDGGCVQTPIDGLQEMPSSFANMPVSLPAFPPQLHTPPSEASAVVSPSPHQRPVSDSGGAISSSRNQVKSRAAEGTTAKTQVEKVKETNRKAQRRYRDRQREKLAAAEDKVAELTTQLSRLQTEKDTVTASHELLARCLAIQQQQQAQGPSFVTQKQNDAWWIDAKTQQLQGVTLADDITFTVWPDSHIKMSQQQVVDMPLDQTAAMWRAYHASFSNLLKVADGDEHSPAGKRLARLWFESMQMWGVLFTCFPDRVDSIMAKLLADEERDAVHAHHHDAEDLRLAAVVGFTQPQRRALVDLRRRLHTNLGMLQNRRDVLTRQLQEVIPLRPGQSISSSGSQQSPTSSAGSDATSGRNLGGLISPHLGGGGKISGNGGHGGSRRTGSNVVERGGEGTYAERQFGATVSAMDGLKETLRDEHCCFIQGLFIFWSKLLRPIQATRLSVEAFPHDARPMAIADYIALQDGEPDSAVLLEDGLKRYNEELLPLEEALPSTMRMEFVPPIDYGLDAKGDLLRH